MQPGELIALVLPLATGVGLVALASLVAKTGWMHPHNRLFSALYLLSGLKSMADGLTATVTERDGAHYWADQFHASAPLFPNAHRWQQFTALAAFWMLPLLALLVSRFPKPAGWTQRWPRLQWLAFVPAVGFTVALFARPAWFFEGDQPGSFALSFLAVLVTLAAVYLLLRARQAAANSVERKQATYLLIGFVPSFAATWLITGLVFLIVRALHAGDLATVQALVRVYDPLSHYASPLLELAAAGFVAYAILKYRLLAVELKVKGGVKYGVMTFTVGATIFLLNTYITNFVLQAKVFAWAGAEGSAVITGIVGMLLFKPVERFGGYVTDRLFPDTANKATYAQTRGREIYLSQLTHIIRDAQVTDKEWDLLRRLRRELHLDAATARAVEQEAEREMGVDIPDLGDPRVAT